MSGGPPAWRQGTEATSSGCCRHCEDSHVPSLSLLPLVHPNRIKWSEPHLLAMGSGNRAGGLVCRKGLDGMGVLGRDSASGSTVRARPMPALGEPGPPRVDTGSRGLERKRQDGPWRLDLGFQNMKGCMAE